MNWTDISKQSTLTEDFMREHADSLDWISICLQKNLSLDFMKEMIEYMYLEFLRSRLQSGILPNISNEDFKTLENWYKQFWEKRIRTLGCLFEPEYVNGEMKINKTKINIPFTLDENIFPTSRLYTKLSFSFEISYDVFNYTIHGFPHVTSKKTVIPFSSLFHTRQQKDAFFYCINHFLVNNKLTEEPITFFYG